MAGGSGMGRWSVAVFVAAVAVICGLAAFVGLAPLHLFGHDVFFLLDNGYRVLQGQVPHRDFSTAWGPVFYLIEAAGLRLSGLRPQGIGYANAFFAAVIGAWAWWIGRSRLLPFSACTLGVYAALIVAAPFPLGYEPWMFSCAMIYNRYGFALLAIVVVECVAHVSDGGRRAGGAWGALSTGLAFALLAFLKLTYAIAAVPFLLFHVCRRTGRGIRLISLAGGTGLAAALFLWYLRFDFSDMIRDLTNAAIGRSRTWYLEDAIVSWFGQSAQNAPLLCLAIAVAESGKDGWRSAVKTRLRELAIAVIVLVVGGFLLSTNMQLSGTLVLNGCAVIVLADVFICRYKTGRLAVGNSMTVTVLIAFLVASSLGPLFFRNAWSLVAAAVEEHRLSGVPILRLESRRGASIIFAREPFETENGGAEYVKSVNEGLALLRRYAGAREGVLAIDMFNPFNYLLDRPSPRGGIAAAAYDWVLSEDARPSADRLIGDARYVIVRKYGIWHDDLFIKDYRRLYEPEVAARFSLLEETRHWRLYGPKGDAGSPLTPAGSRSCYDGGCK